MVHLNQIFSQNVGKIMYALLLMSILETLSTFIILSPVLNSAETTHIFFTRISTIVLAFISLCVWLTFQFGFAIMLLRMTRRQHVNLGYIFIGFKKFNPAGKVIFSFAAIFSVFVVIARFIAKILFSKINPDFSFQSISMQDFQNISENSEFIYDFAFNTLMFMGIFIGVLFVISLLTLPHFVFVFHLHFDKPSLSVPALFSQSASLMKKNVFRLILFAIRAGGKQLAVALILALVLNFIPNEKSGGIAILIFLLDIVYFVNLYTALIRIYLTVPVLYENLRNQEK